MKIVMDVDGVVADLHTEWLRRYNRDYNDKLTANGITGWSLSKFVVPACGNKIFDYLHEADLYDHVQPYPNAVAGINLLRENGHRVVFVTSCVKGMADQKWTWLETHGFLPPRFSHKDLVITADKNNIRGDLIVDDSYDHVSTFEERGILFDQPWNRGQGWRGLFATNWTTNVGGVPYLVEAFR